MQVWPQVTKTNSNHLDASRYLKDAIRVTFQNWNALWGFLPLVAHLTCTHFCTSACAEELHIRLVHALSCDVRGKKKRKKILAYLHKREILRNVSFKSQLGVGGASGVTAEKYAVLACSTGIYLSSLYSLQLRMCFLPASIWPLETCSLHVSQFLVLLHIHNSSTLWLGWAPRHQCH